MDKQYLKDFENEIADLYGQGIIKGPVHLRSGCEDALITIFSRINLEVDWIFSTWANHYHALLFGIPPLVVKGRILSGNSMAMNFSEKRFYTSAIVGGCASIAVGVAEGLRRKDSDSKVWCFLGDCAVLTGTANEAMRYSRNHNLNVVWVVEDNGISVTTPTEEMWKASCYDYIMNFYKCCRCSNKPLQKNYPIYFHKNEKLRCIYYRYINEYPHSGVNKFISF